MKIIYLVHQFYPEYYTGTEKFVYNMASKIKELGNEVKVITYSFYNNSFYDCIMGNVIYKEFEYKQVPVLAFKLKNNQSDINLTLEDKDIEKFAEYILEIEKPDIIHIGHPMRVQEFIKLAIKLKISYIITLTDFFLMCPRGILLTKNWELCNGPDYSNYCQNVCNDFSELYIKKRLEQAEYIFLNAKKVISPSKFLANMFKRVFPNIRIDVINHGIQRDNSRANSRIYTRDSEITFCYGGSLNYHKGVHVLIKAFRELQDKNVKLKIYGSGEKTYYNILKYLSKDDERIEFCGVFLEDQTAKILNLIDVMVVPSIWYENYPLILHEALVYNIPVISSNIGGMAEKIKDGFNGFVFDVGNYKKLKEKMTIIIENPSILNHIKENIRNHVIIPTVEEEANNYMRIYEEICTNYK